MNYSSLVRRCYFPSCFASIELVQCIVGQKFVCHTIVAISISNLPSCHRLSYSLSAIWLVWYNALYLISPNDRLNCDIVTIRF